VLLFLFVPSLTGAGGTVDLALSADENACMNAGCNGASVVRLLTDGSVTSVPEPSSLGLLALGVVALLVAKQRWLEGLRR